jgi:hypothetical protein
MDPNLLRESENVEDRRTDEPLPPDWLTQQERPDLPPGVIGSDAYWRQRKREGRWTNYVSLDPEQLAYQLAWRGAQSPNPYTALIGASPQRQPFPVGQPQSFYNQLQQLYGAVPGNPPSDARQFLPAENFPDANVPAGPMNMPAEEDEDIPLPRPRPSEHEDAGLPSQDEEDMPPDTPFRVLSPSRIRLGPAAQHWAQEHGMSLTEFAKYLLQREKMRNAGLTD